jgi:hypothetical protein
MAASTKAEKIFFGPFEVTSQARHTDQVLSLMQPCARLHSALNFGLTVLY